MHLDRVKIYIALRLVLTINLICICASVFAQTDSRWRWYELHDYSEGRASIITQDSNFNWYDIVSSNHASNSSIVLKNQVSQGEIRNSTTFNSLNKRSPFGHILKSTKISGIPIDLNWMNDSMLIAICGNDVGLQDTAYFYQLRYNSELKLLDSLVIHTDHNVNMGNYTYGYRHTIKNKSGMIWLLSTRNIDSFQTEYTVHYINSLNATITISENSHISFDEYIDFNVGVGNGHYAVLKGNKRSRPGEKTRLAVFDSLGNLAFERLFPREMNFNDIIFNERNPSIYMEFRILADNTDSFKWNNEWLYKKSYYYMILNYETGSVQVNMKPDKLRSASCYKYRGAALYHYGSKKGFGPFRYKNFKPLDSISRLKISSDNNPSLIFSISPLKINEFDQCIIGLYVYSDFNSTKIEVPNDSIMTHVFDSSEKISGYMVYDFMNPILKRNYECYSTTLEYVDKGSILESQFYDQNDNLLAVNKLKLSVGTILDKVYVKHKSHYGYYLYDTIKIKFIDSLNATFDTPDSTCQFNPTTFNATSQADTIHPTKGESFVWEFWQNDTVWHSSTKQNPIITFDRPGWYTVKMKYDNGFCFDWKVKDSAIYVKPARKPGFVFDRQSACSPGAIGIQDRSSGWPAKVSYLPDSLNIENSKFKIATSGLVRVVQLNRSENGCITSDTQSIMMRSGIDSTRSIYPILIETSKENYVAIHWDSLGQKRAELLLENGDKIALSQNSFFDRNGQADSFVFEYQFKLVDSCGRSSKPVIFQNLLLEYDVLNDMLKWNQPLNDPVFNLQFSIINDGIEKKLGETYSFPAGELDSKVQVVAVDSIHQIRFVSNVLDFSAGIALPNAFSPNGDGINDVLSFNMIHPEDFEITIYSRWGQIVAKSNNPMPVWDGSINGDVAPVGVYFYVLRLGDKVANGTINLIK